MANRDQFTSASASPLTGPDYLDNVSGHLKVLLDKISLPVTSPAGTNTYTGTVDPEFDTDGYVAGMRFAVTWPSTNTSTTVTLNLNSEGALSVRMSDGVAPAIGDLMSGTRDVVEYDGTNLRVVGRTISQVAAVADAQVALGGGSLVNIAEIILTGGTTAVFDGADFDNSVYDSYEFEFMNVTPGTDGDAFRMRTNDDGGATFDSATGNYGFGRNTLNATAGAVATDGGSGDSSTTTINLTGGVGSASGEHGVSGLINLHGAPLVKRTNVTGIVTYANTDNDLDVHVVAGRRNETAEVGGVQFYFSTGVLESGTIVMRGKKKV
jgi:hypothetical protein